MAMVPFTDRDERLLTIDNLGSGLIMYQDKLLGNYQAVKTLLPGSLTSVQRIARTDLLNIEGAHIKESDTGLTYEVKSGIWVRSISDQIQSLMSGAGIPAGIYGFTAANTRRLRAALAKVYAGTGRVKVGLIGDSTTVGEGSTAAGATNCVAKAFPAKLAALLTARGLTSQSNAFFGDGGSFRFGLGAAVQDPRLVLGANWSNGNGDYSPVGGFGFGGSYLVHGNAATDALSFTPSGAFNTIDVYTFSYPGNGSATVNIDGGASLGTVNTNVAGGLALQKTTLNCANGTHTINVVPASAANICVVGIDTWSSVTPAVSLLNLSHRGATVTDFTNCGVAGLLTISILPSLTCDAFVVDLLVNDSAHLGNWSTPSQYQTYLQQLVSALLPTADVIFRFGAPSQLAWNASTADVSAYVTAAKAVIATYGLPVLDLRSRWVSYETSPEYYFNGLHPSGAGYADEAQQAAVALLGL